MVFPFAVKYKRTLRGAIPPDQQQYVLQQIKAIIAEQKADNIAILENEVTYKGSTSWGNWSKFRVVDGGTFSIKNDGSKTTLTYQVRMRGLFIITPLMAIFMGISSGLWYIGLGAFLWLGGMNWVISVVRHHALASEIACRIDDTICGKIEVVRSEELKSWM
jgi:hypothetical protein